MPSRSLRRARSSGSYGEAVDAGGSPAAARATEQAARAAAQRVAERLGAVLVSIEFESGPRDPSPLAVRVRVRLPSLRTAAHARAGIAFVQPVAAEGFRLADVRGLDEAGAVVAAALAQLGWPYVWGGESRAEGGFDCSGLVGYAFAAAGLPVGRLDCGGSPAARPSPSGGGRAAAGRSRLRGRAGPSRRPRGRARAGDRGAVTAARSCTSSRSLRAAGRERAGSCRNPRQARKPSVRISRCPRTCRSRCAPWWLAPRAPSRCHPRCSRRSSRPRAASMPQPARRPARRASRSSCRRPGPATGTRSASAARSSPLRRLPHRRG